MSALTSMDLAAIGGFAGIVEVTLQQPTVTAKNFMQNGLPIPLNPRILYRGWFVNSASIAPICFIHFGTNRFLELTLQSWKIKQDTYTQMGCATMSGVVGSFVSTPSEMVMLHQQISKSGGSLVSTTKNLVSEHGPLILFRGQVPCIFRESLWAGAYLGLVPVVENKLSQTQMLGGYPNAVWATAAVGSGLLGALVTHPFDTIKTRMQANLTGPDAPKFSSFIQTTRDVAAKGELYAGLTPRAARMVGATFILSGVKTNVSRWLENYRSGSK